MHASLIFFSVRSADGHGGEHRGSSLEWRAARLGVGWLPPYSREGDSEYIHTYIYIYIHIYIRDIFKIYSTPGYSTQLACSRSTSSTRRKSGDCCSITCAMGGREGEDEKRDGEGQNAVREMG
jgi:hypothetical protein